MDDDRALLTIGQLARRTSMPVRTIRYRSDIGVVSPVGRTDGGYRVYDAAAVARLELVATLRQGVLATVAKRGSSTKEMALMNRLARLSAAERKQLIDDFVEEVFSGLEPEPGLQAHLRRAPDLPEDPTPEQVDAWVELAELVADPEFRRRVRTMAEYGAREREQGGLAGHRTPEENMDFVGRVVEHAGDALQRGVAPESAAGAEILDRILGDTPNRQHRQELLRHL